MATTRIFKLSYHVYILDDTQCRPYDKLLTFAEVIVVHTILMHSVGCGKLHTNCSLSELPFASVKATIHAKQLLWKCFTSTSSLSGKSNQTQLGHVWPISLGLNWLAKEMKTQISLFVLTLSPLEKSETRNYLYTLSNNSNNKIRTSSSPFCKEVK